MKKRIQVFAVACLLLVGCGKRITSTDLNAVDPSALLLKTKEEAVEILGASYKEQKRTGGMFALYFQDQSGTVLSANFRDRMIVDFVVCPSSMSLLPKGKEGWILTKEMRFDEEVEVFTESSSGHSIFLKEDCIYFTTNWIQK